MGSAGADLETCGYSPRYGGFSRAHTNRFGVLRVQSTPDELRLQFVLAADGSVWDEAIVTPWPR